MKELAALSGPPLSAVVPVGDQRATPARRPGEERRSAGAFPGSRTVIDGGAGLLFGYLVLHPVSMLIFAYLDPRLAHPGGGGQGFAAWGAFAHSFAPEMLPMGAVFALFTAIIATISGHYRRALAGERDRLRHQLSANEGLRAELEAHADTLRRQNATLERLERANRRQTQFMVHDFKGHLQVILGFTSTLLESAAIQTNSDAVEALTRIERQAVRMNGSVHDLLDFARLQESPQLRVQRESVISLLQRAADDAAVPSHLGCVSIGGRHTGCPDLLVDARLIERVLVNLASNALKHNRRGTRVELDASPDERRRAVVFCCADDGRGLSAEAQASLFKAFAAGIGPAVEDSTGLGLAFCKAAVEAHGGRIWCESSEGAGACFYFTIPLGTGG